VPEAAAPLAIVIPILGACLLLATGKLLPQWAVDGIAASFGLAAVAMTAILLHGAASGRVVHWSGGWTPRHGSSVGIPLIADRVSAGAALTVSVLVLCALVFSWRYFDDVHAHFPGLVLLFGSGMTGFCLSGDIFDMFVFFELMGAVAYALTGFKIEDPTSVQGALNFGVINSLGAYVSLMGIGLLYSRTGVLGLPQLGAVVDQRNAGHPDPLIVMAFVMIACSFLVKGAILPFHFWLADAHAVAPTPICLLFSGVMVELGLYGVYRVSWVVFGAALPHTVLHHAFVVFGVATAVVGAVMCFAQRHLKRLLAYSTIAHLGLFLVALGTFDPSGTAGALLYAAGHAGAKGALFLLAGIVLNLYGGVDEVRLFGRARKARLLPLMFLVGALALAGLPPFGTALGKSLAEDATAVASGPWTFALYVIVSGVTAGAVLRAAARIFRGWGTEPEQLKRSGATPGDEQAEVKGRLDRLPLSMGVPAAGLLLGCLALGLLPNVGPAFHAAAEQFVDRAGYITSAIPGLHLAPHLAQHPALAPPVPPPAGDLGWSTRGIALGLVSTALAVVLAGLALYGQRIPAYLSRAGNLFTPAVTVLRRLHSGHVGDYVAWLFAGVSGLAALIGLPLK
jgi:multicomponent Na+:H+ antiporter subunit D